MKEKGHKVKGNSQKRGAPDKPKLPPMAVSKPAKQNETTKTQKNWNENEAFELLVFHALIAIKCLCLLAYHNLTAFCNETYIALVEQRKDIAKLVALTISVHALYYIWSH